MSEGNWLGSQLSVEALRCVDRFDSERAQLYDWLAVQTVKLPDLREIHNEAMTRQHDVADRFAHSAVVLKNSVPDVSKATEFVTNSWLNDDVQRVRMFNAIMPTVLFETEDENEIKTGVSEILQEDRGDVELAEDVQENYFTSLTADVSRLLSGVAAMRTMLSVKKPAAPFECQCETTLTLNLRPEYLDALSNRFGTWALSQIARTQEGDSYVWRDQ